MEGTLSSYIVRTLDISSLVAKAEQIVARGWIEPSQLYESPFIDLHPHGVDGVFSDPEVQEMLSILTSIRQNAEGREVTP